MAVFRCCSLVAINLVSSRIWLSFSEPLIRHRPPLSRVLSAFIASIYGSDGISSQTSSGTMSLLAGGSRIRPTCESIATRLSSVGSSKEVEPDLLVEICVVERSPPRVVAHHLIADGIRGLACALLEQGCSGDGTNVPFATLAAPLRQAFGSILFSSPASSDCRSMS